jgi:hypothetical protein
MEARTTHFSRDKLAGEMGPAQRLAAQLRRSRRLDQLVPVAKPRTNITTATKLRSTITRATHRHIAIAAVTEPNTTITAAMRDVERTECGRRAERSGGLRWSCGRRVGVRVVDMLAFPSLSVICWLVGGQEGTPRERVREHYRETHGEVGPPVWPPEGAT